ncbi:MAG TPA: PadR family transcriptional regulator, partial [Bacillales bacterium]|nr:PadR family transcriptional regulator [Bacillales bacterium]
MAADSNDGGFRRPDSAACGAGGANRRVFGRGDMKFVLLKLIQRRPMHGYEMMKALEKRSFGYYSPSPGSIYPTLQMLEDQDL